MSELQDDLNSAFDAMENDVAAPEVSAAPDTIVEDVVVAPELDPAIVGDAGEKKVDTPAVTSTPDVAPKEAPPKEVAAPVTTPTAGLKAPASWTPNQREQWSKVPPDLQARITAREKEIATTLTNTAASRKTHERMSKLGESYAPLLAAEGVNDPVQASEGVFQTVAQLQMGSTQQKAETIANLINHYKVDINALDSAIVGEAPARTPESELERMLEEKIGAKMAPLNKLMAMAEQAKLQGQEQVNANAQKSVQDFSKNAEFLNYVRNDMADMIDFAHSRGQEMSLQDAYNKAVAMNPEVSGVMAQRKTAKAAAMQSKKAAASSIRGRQTATPSANADTSIRGALRAAMGDYG